MLDKTEKAYFESLCWEKINPIREIHQSVIQKINPITNPGNSPDPYTHEIRRFKKEIAEARIQAYIETYQKVGRYPDESEFEEFGKELLGIVDNKGDNLPKHLKGALSPYPSQLVEQLEEQLSNQIRQDAGIALSALHHFINEGKLVALQQASQTKEMDSDKHYLRLKKVYQATGGSQRKAVNLADVLKDEGLSQAEIDNEVEYMEGEEWIKALGDEGIDFYITHTGIKAAQNHMRTFGRLTPVEIQDSLELFKADHPDPRKVAFVMMRFGNTKAHTDIVTGIQNTLDPYGITAVRADDKQYHDDLFPNVLTYIYGCGFGIAIFERIETEEFNPNVALEVGYMFALKKSVCLLKDKTLKTLHADLVSKLYRVFDPLDPIGTIPAELSRWLKDKGIIPSTVSADWKHLLEHGTQDGINKVINSPQFKEEFPDTLTATAFVDKLIVSFNKKVPQDRRAGLVMAMESYTKTRAQILREILEM
jgi:hypothetical protein